jgi:zinc/manganese transport system substrate-binding protein
LKKCIRALAVLLATLSILFASVGKPISAATKLRTVASITIIQDVAKNVAGDLADVDVIVPTDSDAHGYEPKPDDARKLADAQVIFTNGALLEGFLDKLIKTSSTKAAIVMVSKGVNIRKFSEPNASGDKPEFLGISGEYQCQSAKEGEEIGDCDPHFWQNPLNVVKYTENIRDALISADAVNRDAYTRNAAAYIEKLQKLDQDIRAVVKDIPPDNRVIVTNHDALGYFAAEYGFTVAGVILPGGAAGELKEPDPKAVAELIDSLKSRKVKAIFVENISSEKLAKQIASQAGVKVVTGLYTDALGEKGTPGETYLGMMTANLNAFRDALNGK